MDKDILAQSQVHKTFKMQSKADLDITNVVVLDDSLVTVTSGAYIVVGDLFGRHALLSAIDNFRYYINRANKIVTRLNNFSKRMFYRSKISKE